MPLSPVAFIWTKIGISGMCRGLLITVFEKRSLSTSMVLLIHTTVLDPLDTLAQRRVRIRVLYKNAVALCAFGAFMSGIVISRLLHAIVKPSLCTKNLIKHGPISGS